ncbi:methyl-accepting chemotaxis protein [Eubacterium sp. MSJ-13]|uniref:methyl-accepting chemotaxis protein n=1 Tax=Eubacterium sp. MSJ-13 TaxID=2841513 RepID=UPI001C10187B|nr:methyl-accepting chemotaxis protein [Eubacterium sp. MSJ-13]MBU5478466.1 methyl-accepting chemotaxis protein [Eubacterium sp. MSJ-13]
MKKQRNMSIKTKLLGIIIPVVVAIVVVLVLVAYEMSSGMIESYSENLLESSVGNQANEIEAWLDKNIASFQTAKRTIEKLKPNDKELQNMLDGYYGFDDNYPEGLYIADSSGKLMKASESKKSESDVTKSVWYKEGLTRINMKVGSAYKNSEGVNVISASAMINDGTDKVRVISADMTLDRIAIIVNSFIEMNKAEAVLVDKNTGVIIANRDSELISQKIGDGSQSEYYKQLAKNITVKKYDSTTIDGEMTVFKEVDGTDWLLVSYIPKSVILADLVQLRTTMIVISVVCILLLCVLIERVTHVVIKPVKTMTGVITKMTSGDFTVTMDVKGHDEIAVMGESVKKFIATMKQMIKEMGDVSGKLKEQADSSKNVSGEMNSAAAIQSQSMSELNTTVDQLSLSVNEIAESATKLAGVASDTKDDGSQVEDKMNETVRVSEKGREDMKQVSQALESIEQSIRNLEEAVNKVGSASGEIVQIINLIGEIADQTNLLALNASIEAARAGEAGKGFSVVASEIGKLANSSTESVANITTLITQINNLVADAVKQAGSSAKDISGSAVLIHTAVDTFDMIFKNIQDTGSLINEMVEKINEVDAVATNVAAISEEQAASSDEILATSETMLKQAENISKNSDAVEEEADNLALSAQQLENQVNQFQI